MTASSATQTAAHIPVQAKFELDDSDKLSLSIYTTKAGEKTIPEKNGVVESAGDPTKTKWTPTAEDFNAKKDVEHIARSAGFLTLLQLTRTTMEDVAKDLSSRGLVYRVEPEVLNGKPVFNCLVMKADGTAEQVKVAMKPI